MKVLTQQFFLRPTLEVAQELLGKFLMRNVNGQKESFEIFEVEAYDGPNDLASHASRGQTSRNAPMFLAGGIFYIYLVYGMYYMLNIVTGDADYPAAILIRGAGRFNGPGKLTRGLGIDMRLNGMLADLSQDFWFEEHGNLIDARSIVRTSRVGVDYAGPVWSKKEYRFILNRV